MYDTPDDLRKRWQSYVNNAAQEVPAYGIIRVTESTDGVLQAERPNGVTKVFAINGVQACEADAYGNCTNDSPAWALYDSADGAPANGEIWGPGTDTFKLRKGMPGFVIIGNVDATNTIVKVTLEADSNSSSFKAWITNRAFVLCNKAVVSLVGTVTNKAGDCDDVPDILYFNSQLSTNCDDPPGWMGSGTIDLVTGDLTYGGVTVSPVTLFFDPFIATYGYDNGAGCTCTITVVQSDPNADMIGGTKLWKYDFVEVEMGTDIHGCPRWQAKPGGRSGVMQHANNWIAQGGLVVDVQAMPKETPALDCAPPHGGLAFTIASVVGGDTIGTLTGTIVYDDTSTWVVSITLNTVPTNLTVSCTTVDGVVTPRAVFGTYSANASAGWTITPLAATFLMSNGAGKTFTLTVAEDADELDQCVDTEDYVFESWPEYIIRVQCTNNVIACPSGYTPPCYGHPTLKEYKITADNVWTVIRDLGVCCQCNPNCLTPPCDCIWLPLPCDCTEPPESDTPCWPIPVPFSFCGCTMLGSPGASGTATVTGIGDGTCDQCVAVNRTYSLHQVGSGDINIVRFESDLYSGGCIPYTEDFYIIVDLTCAAGVITASGQMGIGGNGGIPFDSVAGVSCTGPVTFTIEDAALGGYCIGPVTITVSLGL